MKANFQRVGKSGVRWALFRREKLLFDGVVYLNRLRLVQTPWFGVYLHRFEGPDPDPDMHDHPYSFATLILRGGYVELFDQMPYDRWRGLTQCRQWKAGSLHVMAHGEAHRILSVAPHTTTLMFVGKRVGGWADHKDWGFYTDKGFVWFRDYERQSA